MRDTLGVLLAGGAGERLYPLTRDRAKPAVTFGGIYRIIDITLSNCINSDLRSVYILTQYKALSLNRHIREGWGNVVGRELGEFIEILPPMKRVSENWYMGTADAVYQNIYSIGSEQPKYVLDPVGRPHLQDELRPDAAPAQGLGRRRHAGDHPDRSVGDAALRRGRDRPHRPRHRFPGEARADRPALALQPAHGVGLHGHLPVQRRCADSGAAERCRRPDSRHDFGHNILPRMVDDVKVYSFNFIDENKKEALYWRDVGTLEAYYEANMDLVSVAPVFNVYDEEWPIRTHMRQYPPAKFVFNDPGRTGEAHDSIVSMGCIVSGGSVRNCVLSPDVRVNSYSRDR